jgi:hypothetical protein
MRAKDGKNGRRFMTTVRKVEPLSKARKGLNVTAKMIDQWDIETHGDRALP